MIKNLYKIYPSKGKTSPIILSVPHAGTKIPDGLKKSYKKRMRRQLDDTDWDVHKLYRFAQDLGITIIKANYSRWVIDLNRNPDSAPLYKDGRVITGLTPTTDFLGNDIYRKGFTPDSKEVKRRLEHYYWPYYKKITFLLKARKKVFGKALLWDAHSIRAYVPSISEDRFPDLILGNNDGLTAHAALTEAAIEGLGSEKYSLSINSPFKGGHITRYFGQPQNDIHALQLEMNKILYMDDRELMCDETRAKQVQEVLHSTFEKLLKTIHQL